jgi:hypothetical protein
MGSMTEKTKDILQLCEKWKKAAYQDDGRIVTDTNTEQYRLMANNINFHELDSKQIQDACIGLANVLLVKGMNTIISNDHLYFWSWIAQILIHRKAGYFTEQDESSFTEEDENLKELFVTCVRAALTGMPQFTMDRRYDEMDLHTCEFVMRNNLIMAHLSFPLLEAVVKKACKEYVDYKGKVLKDFSISGRRGKIVDYGRWPKKTKISSLGDLLSLLYQKVAGNNLKDRLTSIRSHLSTIDSSDPFYLIYDWRNSSLHGQSSYSSIGGTVLNIAIAIALDEIADNYDEHRIKIWGKIQWLISMSPTSYRSHMDFYPPDFPSFK